MIGPHKQTTHPSPPAGVTAGPVAEIAPVLGNPFDTATTMGPLVNAKQRDRVLEFLRKGAGVITGGAASEGADFFVEPTVLVGRNDMAVARFDTDDEAIALANANQYGLSATLWTTDVSPGPTLCRAASTRAPSRSTAGPRWHRIACEDSRRTA